MIWIFSNLIPVNWKEVAAANIALITKKNDLNSLKFDTSKLDLDKLQAVPNDIKKPIKSIENDVFKNVMHNCYLLN